MIGELFSHYTIIEKLGEGAMGVVYKAEDTKLGRFVALKFFPADLKADKEKKERFIREAMTASALDHANIYTVHEIGEANDGRMFICMALYEGGTLAEKIKEGPLNMEEVIDVSLQVAQGMEKVHRKGIIHRDIKPQNLILTLDGVVKIVDFGLAKLVGQGDLTREGVTVGTVGYMSPEQARGDEVGQRTDIWSLGVVIYEMVTGQLPFNGEYAQAVIYSILNEEPEPITSLRSKIPLDLERIVNKCLSKECADRYQHLDELIVDLNRLKEKKNAAAVPSKRAASIRTLQNRSLRFAVLGILAAVIIFMSGYFFFDKKNQPGVSQEESLTAESKSSIAVLPFKNLSPGQLEDHFCEGVVEEIIIALKMNVKLRVVSLTPPFQFKWKDIGIRKIGSEYNVKTLLVGSLRKADNRLVIIARLKNVSDSTELWGDKFEKNVEDIIAAQEEIARKVVSALKIELTEKQNFDRTKHHAENIEAYTLYLEGRHCWRRRLPQDLEKGIDLFHQAIKKAPNYALAWVGLADSYHLQATYSVKSPVEAFPEAEKAAQKALEIDNQLGEAHSSLAAIKLVYYWDWQAAEEEFKLAVKFNPNFHTAREWYAIYLAVTNRIDKSIAEMKRAVELKPLSTSPRIGLARHLYFARKYDEAITHFQLALKSDPNSFLAHGLLGQTYIANSMYPKAIDHFKKAMELAGNSPGMLCGLGYAYAVSGKQKEAREILNRLKERSNQKYIPPIYIAGIYIGLRENDRAFKWLEEAYIDRSEWMIYLNIEPIFDPIRNDPRFSELVKRVGLIY
ncbi:MAG: protein kinase [Candidatus Aminicenantes bacterium]|nr:protein kinase [Candidatus Aminicenantes bacterium]NIM77261.1 protein kinase [Candidatus Aminicenantes bacterium]NIN16562.1 protein kinase [Candidatus Aminicenantes bacterium]NIN40420.1 protein kinase [Candidatus Aminicenantes bacterium]NIN83240.1 protein kinase [Candidatus Aminicenantes bacterium]